MSLVGSSLRGYQVIEKLGQGGMAVVYKGFHPELQRTVALKVLKDELAADEEFVRRFHREALTAAGLKQDNIVTIYDAGTEGKISYIVMEYLPGRTLQQEINEQGAPTLMRTAEIIRALANALDYAHERELVHRDVKPSNVMIGPDGRTTLMDFGIVKAAAGLFTTGDGVRIGTPEYMSPEQAAGGRVDYRADIYALGVVLYELLVGQVPFHSTSSHEVLQSHVKDPPPPPSSFEPDLPTGVEKVVLRALAKRPGKRFRTAGQLAAALEQAVLVKQQEGVSGGREPVLKLRTNDGREYALVGVIGLGRSSDNQVQIPDPKVSRHHAQIRSQGAWCQVVDLGSINRTFVNNQPLAPNRPHSLRPGDHVRIGPTFVCSVAVDTVVDQHEPQAHRSSRLADLWKRLRTNLRSCTLALLGGGIVIILLILAVAAYRLGERMEGQESSASGDGLTSLPASGAGTLAELAVINDTGQDLELRIGEWNWTISANQQETIRFPAGEYNYRITLENGQEEEFRGEWQPGRNDSLRLLAP